MFCAVRIALSVGKVKPVGVNCAPERVSREMLSAQGSRLTHSRLIDCIPELLACVGLLPGQGREYGLFCWYGN